MAEISDARALISSGKYREAGRLIDRLLGAQETHELWYLRGVVSLKMRNYDDAIEDFDRALSMRKNALYLRMKGVAKLELFELQDAISDFSDALKLEPDDLLSNFYAAVCYMFLDDPRSAGYLKKAFSIDRKKTKELLKDFYVMFFREDPLISKALKSDLERRIDRIKTN